MYSVSFDVVIDSEEVASGTSFEEPMLILRVRTWKKVHCLVRNVQFDALTMSPTRKVHLMGLPPNVGAFGFR